MPITQERAEHQPRRRSVRVTGRKLAKPAPLSVRTQFGLDPRDGARIRIAMMAGGEATIKELLGAAAFFVAARFVAPFAAVLRGAAFLAAPAFFAGAVRVAPVVFRALAFFVAVLRRPPDDGALRLRLLRRSTRNT